MLTSISHSPTNLYQALLHPAGTWLPIDALQLHASMWTGCIIPALDCHMLPLAGTRPLESASLSDTTERQPQRPSSPTSPLASATATLAMAAASEFTREDARDEHISNVHFQSPWALGGVSRLQCYIHTLTSSIATAQTALRLLTTEFQNHTAETSAYINAADNELLHAHRVESGDSSMVRQRKDAMNRD
jgi:hypothetical protein